MEAAMAMDEQESKIAGAGRYVHPKYGPPGPEWTDLPLAFRATREPFVRLDGNGAAWIFGQFNLARFLGATPWGEPAITDRTVRNYVNNLGLPQWRNETGPHTRGRGMAHYAACQVIRWGLDGNWRFPCEAALRQILSA